MITTNFLMDTAKEVSAEAFEKFGKVFPSCTYFGKDGYGHLFSKNRTDGGREEFGGGEVKYIWIQIVRVYYTAKFL